MKARRLATSLVAAVLAGAPLGLSSMACNHVYDFEDPDAAVKTGCSVTGCPLASLHCDAVSGLCEACVVDGDCKAPMRRCDTSLHQCFECLQPADCPGGSTCRENLCVHECPPGAPLCDKDEFCDTASYLCLHCRGDAECKMPDRPLCDTPTGRCVECFRDAQCGATPGRPRCDPANERCVQCLRAADCPSAAPICDPGRGQCVAS